MTIKWEPTTEKDYWDMLGVLPPAAQAGRAFQVGEAFDYVNGQPTFQTYKVDPEGVFWVASEPMTFRDFKAEFPNADYYYE